MANTTHTPGPWYVREQTNVQSAPIGCLAYVSTAGARGRTLDEAQANARLIAAAPELLRALQWYVDFAGEPCKPGDNATNLCQHRDCETIRTARAAIAKATEGVT